MRQLSAEMIDFQKGDQTRTRAIALVEKIYMEVDNKIYNDNKTLLTKSVYVKELVTLLSNRFNINLSVDADLAVLSPAAIIPFFGDVMQDVDLRKAFSPAELGTLLSGSYMKLVVKLNAIAKEKKRVLEAIHERRGFIDTAHARVGGYFSKIPHVLVLDVILLKQMKMTPAELVAIIFHETGHAFHGMEYHHRLESTNPTIMEVVQLLNQNKPEKALYVFRTKFTQDEFKKLAVDTSGEIQEFNGIVAKAYVDEIRTQLVNAHYDHTSFEAMADSFVVRFGCGEDIVRALDKLHQDGRGTIERSRALYTAYYMLDVLLYACMFVFMGPLGLAITISVLVGLFISTKTPEIYDFPVERYNRVRHAIISGIKDINLPSAYVQPLIDQYTYITELIQAIQNNPKSIVELISQYLSPSTMRGIYHTQAQQGTEDALNNLLFVSSAKLKLS